MTGAGRGARLDGTLAALADPTRRGVIDLLRRRPLRAGELATALAMSPPAMSRHLRVLRKTGLVEESELADDARVRVYTLRQEPFAALRDWLDEVESFWGEQLAAFKAHAERIGRASPSGTSGRGGYPRSAPHPTRGRTRAS